MENFFSESGFVINGIHHLSAREAFEVVEKGAFLIDLREEFLTSMKTFKLSNYIICPLSDFNENIGLLPKNKPLIVADATGLYSKEAVKILTNTGFTVANLAGGIMDWERNGFHVEKKPNETLSGQCPCMLKPIKKRN